METALNGSAADTPVTLSHRLSDADLDLMMRGIAGAAIYLIDREGLVIDWNEGIAALTGWDASEIIGNSFELLHTPEDRAAGMPQRTLMTAGSTGPLAEQGWHVRKDGSRFFADSIVEPMQDEHGGHIGFAVVLRDVTTQHALEDELNQTRAALAGARKLESIGQLTGGIAHDFNNLLTVIAGSAEMLRRPDLSEDKRTAYIDAIAQTAARAASLVGQLLSFARRDPSAPAVIDLTMRIDALTDLLRRTLGARIEIETDLEPDLWSVRVDPVQFDAAILNAAINARDAMPDGGKLSITTRNIEGTTDQVAVWIADTGEGMAPEAVARAFEPFFTTKPIGAGSGLGLAQVQAFVDQAGGTVDLRSVRRLGTTLSLTFPRVALPVTPEEAHDAPDGLPPGVRVLLVEDSEPVARFAADLLDSLGCSVVLCDSAERAVDWLADHDDFDLLFSDIVMPGMTGIDLAGYVRQKYPDKRVLLTTGYSQDLVDGSAGDLIILSKPYTRDDVLKAFGEALA